MKLQSQTIPFLCLLPLFYKTAHPEEQPIVQTNLGHVRGTVNTSRIGRTFYAFRGIPYAQPPVGRLRFKPPQKLEPWKGILNAQKDAPACIQKNYLFGRDVEGSEDCLFLNVYTPKLRVDNDEDRLYPVMVFIHWGGFFTGYSSSQYLGPEYLMDKNVVMVTFNYRLGVMGFLSTYDDASPGNYGLKDQLVALKWVQNNIVNFGGNKRKVTLFGQSAGGASVHFHMFSSLSKGLFHRAISESGTALALWAKPLGKEQLSIAQLQASLVGCGNSLNSTDTLIDCLRSVDAEQLVKSGDSFKFFSIDPLNVFLPSIEKETKKNPSPFLTKSPTDYIKNNEFYKVPWILGTVGDEGIIRAAPLLSQPETRGNLSLHFNKLMPHLMALVASTPEENVQLVWRKIKDHYFGGKDSVDIYNNNSVQGFVNLYTDRAFGYNLYQTILLHALRGHDKIWLYSFNYKGEYSYRQHFIAGQYNIKYEWGVSHCDELLYLFRSPALFSDLSESNDLMMSNIMVNMWTNFALYGHPTRKNIDSVTKEKWVRVDASNSQSQINKSLRFLNITGSYLSDNSVKLTMDQGFHLNRFKFWETLPLHENVHDLDQLHVEPRNSD